MAKILKLAALAGLGYAGWNALNPTDKTATTKALGFTSTPTDEESFIELIKQTIKSDKELQRLLIGPSGIGTKGLDGRGIYVFDSLTELDTELIKTKYQVGDLFLDISTGDLWFKMTMELTDTNTAWRGLIGNLKGAKGDSGDTVQHYGGSLLKNLSAELKNTDNWIGGTLSAEKYEGVNAVSGTNFGTVSRVFVRKNRLYKLETNVKGTGNFSAYFFESKDYDGSFVYRLNNTSGVYFIQSMTLTNDFQKITKYVGGFGESSSNFPTNSYTTKLGFACNNTCYIAKTVIVEVDLGEAVPHNLPYLPEGQTVVNNTTGAVGRFNGTTVDWYI